MSISLKHPDYNYKIVLVGDSGVGKSNIISRFTKNQFNLQCKTTIGVQFSSKTIQKRGYNLKMQIWDTAGQQRYRSMASAYYRGASGALIIYDITKTNSFENLQKWVKELKSYAAENIVCLLIGNKSDLQEYRAVKRQHGQQYANRHKMGFIQTSALQGANIDEAFNLMIQQILQRNKNKQGQKDKTVSLRKQQIYAQYEQKRQKKNCCIK